MDVFAWAYLDMCEISSEIACHTLNVDLKYPQVKQKKLSLGLERSAALKEEADKLKANGFIHDVLYPE